MLQELLLGAVAIANSSQASFFEEKLTIPAENFEISTTDPWNAVTFFTTDGSPLPELSYAHPNTGEWNEWEALHDELETRDDISELLFFENPTKKLILHADAEKQIIAHFFNTRIPGENLVAQLSGENETLLDQQFLQQIDAFSKQRQPRFISRSEWGANEELRLRDFSPRDLFRKWFQTEERDVEPKYRPQLIQSQENGKTLTWPIKHNQTIRKIIVHNTGEAIKKNSNRTPRELMRAIYSYHTVTRDWGDIGYNYIIDKQGNVYEGRAGGPLTVGGHTAYHNIGSIGIALMGNFNYEKPTDAQVTMLEILAADLSRTFEIDPTGRSEWLGKNSFNISGHRDVARTGHGTSCPGRNLHQRLPEIRKKTAEWMQEIDRWQQIGQRTGRDFLQKSVAAPKVQADTRFHRETKQKLISFPKIFDAQVARRNSSKKISLRVKNTSTEDWPAFAEMQVENTPDGVSISPFRTKTYVRAGQTGTFTATANITKTPNGQYDLRVIPTFLTHKLFNSQLDENSFQLTLQVSGDARVTRRPDQTVKISNNLAASVFSGKDVMHKSAPVPAPKSPMVKIKIAGFEPMFADVSAHEDSVGLWQNGRKIVEIPQNEIIRVAQQELNGVPWLRVTFGARSWEGNSFELKTNGILEIKNYRNPRFGGGNIRYNQFRRILKFVAGSPEKMLVINELPLEEYLWGLAEEPSSEPEAKKKVIQILARSYALVYSGDRRKFRTNLYDLEDDPRTSQLYLGYDWERYHVSQKDLVAATAGQVVTRFGDPVIAPYFTQSDGHSSDKWNSQYPWCRARILPFDEGLTARGHGVGLSGNSARELAKLGKNEQEIIDYFFRDLKIEKEY